MSSYQPHDDAPDPDFSEDAERFYRRLGREYVLEDGAIDYTAINLPGYSLDRQRYRPNPDDVYAEHRDDLPLLAYTEASQFAAVEEGDLVTRQLAIDGRIADEPEVPVQEFMAELCHCPLAKNYAHTEIRVRPAGRPYKEKWNPGPNRRMVLKMKIAALFKALSDPDCD